MIDAVIEELKTHQTQLDQDGVMVGVSRQALEELLAHVAAPAHPAPISGLEPVAWRPIKTAPRDGTPILCFTPDYQSEFSDQSGIDVLWFDEGAWLYNAEPVTFQPTHWMPLPASPNSASSGYYTLAQLEAHAAEQVRAERRGDNTIQRDKIYRAAERSNTRFGQWMPERWVNIFVEEMSK